MRHPFAQFRRTRQMFDGIKLKHQASFGVKYFPFPAGDAPVEEFLLDRWEPETEMGKNKITEYKQAKGGWRQAGHYPLWYGFEMVTEFNRLHSGDYYGIIVIRPKVVDHRTALNIVEKMVA